MHALVLFAWSLVAVTPVQSTPQVAPPTEGIEAVGSVQDPSALTSDRALPRQRTASWLALPFLVLLLMIATGPVLYPGHWHRRYVFYALALGAIVVLYYVFALGRPRAMVLALEEYLSFLALVGALYVASGGIHVQVNAPGTPLTNVILLAVGAVLANLIATTGAAILLIRPYLSLNRGRIRPYHVVFFIIIVGNIGGALLPLGDPPLFVGFLRGVPFFWTFSHAWYVWSPSLLLLLSLFYIIDRRNQAVSTPPVTERPVLHILGLRNSAWVAVIVAAVFVDPQVFASVPEVRLGSWKMPFGVRELVMLFAAVCAYRFADPTALAGNGFSFEPIREVGWLFLGIFATMVPALEIAGSVAREHAHALDPSTFFWATGILSGFLDNAPTYVSFLAAALGEFELNPEIASDVQTFALHSGPFAEDTWIALQAISLAAVFFGALSYIGNAPNYLVKSIADGNGVEAPSFAGYLFRYAIPILTPLYLLIWLVLYSPWGVLS